MGKYGNMEGGTKDILKELGNIGTGNAVTALTQLVGCTVDMDLPVLKILGYQEITALLQAADELQTAVLVEMKGEAQGLFLFLLSESFTEEILNLAVEEKERNILSLDEIDRSFLCELGNIMCGSYIRALGELLEWELMVEVPDLCVDMGGAVLGAMLPRFLNVSDDILLIDNTFRMGGKLFSGKILFMPEFEDLEAMFSALGV